MSSLISFFFNYSAALPHFRARAPPIWESGRLQRSCLTLASKKIKNKLRVTFLSCF